MLGKYYKGFIIKKNKNGYDVYLFDNSFIRHCKTLKEIKYRIDTQTI